jgi:hypothetical protein
MAQSIGEIAMNESYSVWYYSSPALGSIKECEGFSFTFEEACKWFKHHTTNVTANLGWTVMVRIIDQDDCIVAEWKYGEGIVWPKYEEKA